MILAINKTIKNVFRNFSLRTKLLLMLIPVIIMFSISEFFIFVQFKDTLKEEAIETNLKVLQLVKNDIQLKIEEIKNVSTRLTKDPNILNYIKAEASAEYKHYLKDNISKLLFDTIISCSAISNCCLINTNNDYIMKNLFSYTSPENFVSAIYSTNTGRQRPGFGSAFVDGEYVSYYIIPVYDYGNYYAKNNSFLVLTINIDFIKYIIDNHSDKDRRYYVSDLKGNPIYSSSEPLTEHFVQLNRTSNNQNLVQHFKNNLLFYSQIPDIDWMVIINIPLKVIYSKINYLSILAITVNIFTVVAAYLIYNFTLRNFTERIKEINKTMEKIEGGNLNFKFIVKYQDEISQIGSRLNHMVNQLKELVIDVSNKKIQVKEAQLNVLQSQINPHFLYNTLETIRMVALSNGDREAAKITKLLSDLFRYNTSKGSEIVTVKQEVDQINRYLEIQKFRYKDKFDVLINIDPEIMKYKILKLTLQPIVENSIYHGIEPKLSSSYIKIQGIRLNNFIQFTVEDNGIGIEEEELKAIKESLGSENSEYTRKGIGIKNVNDRIRLFFNIENGVQIHSIRNKGTKIIITIPITEEIIGENEYVEGIIG
jgi:two-component system sensor histidine kinase YesM